MTLISRMFRALLLAAAGLLLISACGSDPTGLVSGQPGEDDPQTQESGQEGEDGDPIVPDDQDDPVLAGDEEVPAGSIGDGAYERVESRLDLVSTQAGSIEELAVDADGVTVLVRYTNAAEPCSGARVTTVETDTFVEVSLETGLDPNAAAMTCIAQIFAYEIAVPLAAAVGDRELIAVQPGPQGPEDGDPFEGAEFPTDQYLGLTEAEAIELGGVEQREVRVARIDDEIFMLTQDFSPTRVNIEIEAGIVVVATSG